MKTKIINFFDVVLVILFIGIMTILLVGETFLAIMLAIVFTVCKSILVWMDEERD